MSVKRKGWCSPQKEQLSVLPARNFSNQPSISSKITNNIHQNYSRQHTILHIKRSILEKNPNHESKKQRQVIL